MKHPFTTVRGRRTHRFVFFRATTPSPLPPCHKHRSGDVFDRRRHVAEGLVEGALAMDDVFFLCGVAHSREGKLRCQKLKNATRRYPKIPEISRGDFWQTFQWPELGYVEVDDRNQTPSSQYPNTHFKKYLDDRLIFVQPLDLFAPLQNECAGKCRQKTFACLRLHFQSVTFIRTVSKFSPSLMHVLDTSLICTKSSCFPFT